MDERSCDTLRFFFQKFCDNGCEMSEAKFARVFLINMDSVDAEKELSRLKKTYPGLPLILTSIKPIETNEHYFLRKPMIADHLITILGKISDVSFPKKKVIQQQNEIAGQSENIRTPEPRSFRLADTEQQINGKEMIAFIGDLEDVDLRNSANVDKIFFDMEAYFLAYLKKAYQQAKKDNCVVKITGLWKPIILFSESNKIYIEMSAQQLKSICAVSLDSSSIAKVDIKLEALTPQKAILFCENNKNYQRLDTFMWKIALWTSRGRLPQGIPLDSALYLLGWPNLTRLILTPEVLRITAFWVPYPRTIINLIEELAVPQRYVFSFITASFVLGLSGIANRESDNLVLPPATSESLIKMNLFSRTMKRLRSGE